jgi:hypothetical protein
VIPPQTLYLLAGTIVALSYAIAVIAIGALALRVAIGRSSSAVVGDRLGLHVFLWLGFVVGQGIMSLVWLTLSLMGIFYPWPIWVFCTIGWVLACAIAFRYQNRVAESCRIIWTSFLSLLRHRSWYFWVTIGLIVVIILSGVISLLPTGVDDALRWYLVLPKVVATTHRLELLPFLSPYYGLQPLQVEMHWAALFAISNEAAVTFWDFICASSSLLGIGFLAWALTSSRRVAIIAILMMLSTSGFYNLIGGGKPDNAAAQYGIAAFLWLVLLPASGRRSLVIFGLCVGWMLAARYTNFILLPALIIFAAAAIYRASRASPVEIVLEHSKKFWLTYTLTIGVAACLAGLPILIKNWILTG